MGAEGVAAAQAMQQEATAQPGLQQQTDYANLMAGLQLGGLGINAEQTALQQQGAIQQQGVAQQGFAEQKQQNQVNYADQLQNLIGGAAASGNLNTGGAKQQEQLTGLQAQWAGETLGQQETLSQGDFARAMQNYQLVGQANGLSQQEVYARLQYGLQQAGQAADPTSMLAGQAGNVSAQAQGVGANASSAGLIASSSVDAGANANSIISMLG